MKIAESHLRLLLPESNAYYTNVYRKFITVYILSVNSRDKYEASRSCKTATFSARVDSRIVFRRTLDFNDNWHEDANRISIAFLHSNCAKSW